jgi:hypothetical protein
VSLSCTEGGSFRLAAIVLLPVLLWSSALLRRCNRLRAGPRRRRIHPALRVTITAGMRVGADRRGDPQAFMRIGRLQLGTTAIASRLFDRRTRRIAICTIIEAIVLRIATGGEEADRGYE